MMPIAFQVAGLLADQQRAELLREAARHRQLVAAREVTAAVITSTRSDGSRARMLAEMLPFAAGGPSGGSSR